MYSCDANENRSSAFRCNLLEYSTPLVVGDDFDPFRFFWSLVLVHNPFVLKSLVVILRCHFIL